MSCLTSAWRRVGLQRRKRPAVFGKRQRREDFLEDSTLDASGFRLCSERQRASESQVRGLPLRLQTESSTTYQLYTEVPNDALLKKKKDIVNTCHTNSSRWIFYSGKVQDLLLGKESEPVNAGVWKATERELMSSV